MSSKRICPKMLKSPKPTSTIRFMLEQSTKCCRASKYLKLFYGIDPKPEGYFFEPSQILSLYILVKASLFVGGLVFSG